MSTRLVFDLAPMTCQALGEAAFVDGVSVRLRYEHPEDMPERLLEQIPKHELINALQVAGNIASVEGAEQDALVLFTVTFGSKERDIVCKYVDLVPVERLEDGAADYQLMYRRQFKEAHEEALQRRAEGFGDATEASVEEERLDKDPTGSGEQGVPPMAGVRDDGAGVYRLNYHMAVTAGNHPLFKQFPDGWTEADMIAARGTIEDVEKEDGVTVYDVEFVRESDSAVAMIKCRRDDLVLITHEFAIEEAEPGRGAPFITKVYLEGTTTPILVHGEARAVAAALEAGTGFVWFQVVSKDGMMSHDEVGLLYSQTKSVKSDNVSLDA